jgi:hypothetical protein
VEPIEFLLPLEDVTLPDVGLSAEFSCQISKAGLKAEWRKDGAPIKKCDKYKMVDEESVHKLVIEDGQADDEAEYTVLFRDDATSTAKLFVHGNATSSWHMN